MISRLSLISNKYFLFSWAKTLKLPKEDKKLHWSSRSQIALLFDGLTFVPVRGDTPNEDETFVYLVYDLENSTIKTSIFSDYENIILVFFDKVFLMLWCKSWGKVAHFSVYKNKRFLERNGDLYYSTNNWKSKSVIKKVWLQTNDKRLRHVLWAIIFIANIRSFVL